MPFCSFYRKLIFLAGLITGVLSVKSQDPAEWTIMVYMNGDNNLNDDALVDFMEMANAKPSKQVNIVVQFDRLGDQTKGANWSQTLRFKIQPNVFPVVPRALSDIGEKDMGDAATLVDFVTWAKDTFPARKYMLVIWDHGQGWRLMQAMGLDAQAKVKVAYNRSPKQASYRSVSRDETNNSELYNRAIQNTMEKALNGNKIDILAFDACLMSMVESGYAFRNIAKYLVASEELEPAKGWDYKDWLTELAKKPTMAPDELAKGLVASYKKTYKTTDGSTTLSATDLSKMNEVAAAIDNLAGLLIEKLPAQWESLKLIRNLCLTYDPDLTGPFYHIDLKQFCMEIQTQSRDEALIAAAVSTGRAINGAVIDRYAGERRGGNFGSYGLAIYFPKSKEEYVNDPFQTKGYEKIDGKIPQGVKFPLEFVEKHRWADFLHAYFDKVPQ